MGNSEVRLSRTEIAELLYRCLGRLLVVFANIELNIAVSLANAWDDGKLSGDFRTMDQAKFYEKLELFFALLVAECGEDDDRYCEYFAWYMAADSIREARNRFAHGRWAFLEHAQSVNHVAGYPDAKQDERHYSFDQLNAILDEAELVRRQLDTITRARCP